MLISLAEYARIHDKEVSTIRYKCLRGGYKTARKIGRNWVIDDKEPYIDLRLKGAKTMKYYVTGSLWVKGSGYSYTEDLEAIDTTNYTTDNPQELADDLADEYKDNLTNGQDYKIVLSDENSNEVAHAWSIDKTRQF
jgi:hypothetical protein